MNVDEWNRRDTYSWRNVTSNKVEISGTVVHGRTRISIVGNDIYFFGNYADGYNEEEDTPIVYKYNFFDERFASDRFTKETEEVVLCSGIEKIRDYAFYNCVNLRKIIIPESVKEIERTSFVGCMNLTVYTPAGSYAEKYAREKGITVVSYKNREEELLKRSKKLFNKDSVLADVTEVSLSYGKSISYELKTGKLSYRNTIPPSLGGMRFPDGYFDEKTILLNAHQQKRCKKLLEKHLKKLPLKEKWESLLPFGARHEAFLRLSLKDGGELCYANTYCCESRVERKPIQKGFLRLYKFFAGFCEFQGGFDLL